MHWEIIWFYPVLDKYLPYLSLKIITNGYKTNSQSLEDAVTWRPWGKCLIKICFAIKILGDLWNALEPFGNGIMIMLFFSHVPPTPLWPSQPGLCLHKTFFCPLLSPFSRTSSRSSATFCRRRTGRNGRKLSWYETSAPSLGIERLSAQG